MKTHIALFLLLTGAGALFVVSTPAEAGPRGGARTSVNAGGGAGRASAGASNVGASAGASSRSASTSRSSSTSRDVNVDRDVDVDVDVDHDGGCCWSDRDRHPVAVGAAVAVTAVAIGSAVSTIPPSCVSSTVDGVAYYECDGTWYQPQFDSGSTTYIVVEEP